MGNKNWLFIALWIHASLIGGFTLAFFVVELITVSSLVIGLLACIFIYLLIWPYHKEQMEEKYNE